MERLINYKHWVGLISKPTTIRTDAFCLRETEVIAIDGLSPGDDDAMGKEGLSHRSRQRRRKSGCNESQPGPVLWLLRTSRALCG